MMEPRHNLYLLINDEFNKPIIGYMFYSFNDLDQLVMNKFDFVLMINLPIRKVR